MRSQRFSMLLSQLIFTPVIGPHAAPVVTNPQPKTGAVINMSASDSLTETEINTLLGKRGSANHLRAFVKNLNRQSSTYKPLKLTQDEFEAIIESNWKKGKNKRY